MNFKRLGKRSFHYLARLQLARATAYLLAASTTRERVFGDAPARKRALVLSANKGGVMEDFEACFEEANSFELVTWPSGALEQISAAILTPGLAHNRYVTSDPGVEASKQRYREFLRKVWKHYIARLPIDVVLSVNFGYYIQREFAAAMEESGTPFVVLQKENLNGITPRRADFWRVIYEKGRGKFSGRKILVYNDIERDLEITSGIVDPGRVIVTGMPRLDRVHEWRRQHAGTTLPRPQLLFFGFSRKDKVPVIFGKNREKLHGMLAVGESLEQAEGMWSDLSWDELCTETCKAVANFARSHPDVKVIVKTKAQKQQISDTVEFLKGGQDLPANIEVISGGDSFQLITESSAVVGFNTTGLIEAVAAGKPVIVPWFGEVKNEAMQDIILDLGDAVDYAHSPDQLTEKIAQHIDTKAALPGELPPKSCKMLKRLVGNDDGCAGPRVLAEIEKEIAAG